LLLDRTGSGIIAAPFVGKKWPANVVGVEEDESNKWELWVEAARKLGCEILYMEENSGLYAPCKELFPELFRTETVSETEDLRKEKKSLNTPYGVLMQTSLIEKGGENAGVGHLDSFVKEKKDFKAFEWYLDYVLDRVDKVCCRKKERVLEAVAEVNGAGMVCSSGCAPYGFWAYVRYQELLYHNLDFPAEMKRCRDKIHEVDQALMLAALEAGAEIFRFNIAGRERFTRELFEEEVLSYLKEDVRLLRERGGFSYAHCCGHLKEFVETGYYNEVKPHLLESFSGPPEGDIDDLRWAREMVAPEICTRGNVSLALLRNGTPEDVVAATETVLDSVDGTERRHIVSGTDALFDGTPFDNVAAMVETVRRYRASPDITCTRAVSG